jgi:hypothetical protein
VAGAEREPAATTDAARGNRTPLAFRVPASDDVKHLVARLGHDLIMFPTVPAVTSHDGGEVLLGQRSDNRERSIILNYAGPATQTPCPRSRRKARQPNT